MTRTAIATSRARAGSPVPTHQPMNVTAASTSTIGTKMADTRSARRWIGALVVWARSTSRAMPLVNYEVGSKFAFFYGHMTWNSAIYYEAFKNFQLSAPIVYPDGNHGLGFSNVGGTTKVLGFESELAYQTTDDRFNLIFSAIPKKKLGTLVYAGSNDYQGLPACPPASNLTRANVTGNDLPHAPDVSLTAIYEHTFHLGNGGRPPYASRQCAVPELAVAELLQPGFGRQAESLRAR